MLMKRADIKKVVEAILEEYKIGDYVSRDTDPSYNSCEWVDAPVNEIVDFVSKELVEGPIRRKREAAIEAVENERNEALEKINATYKKKIEEIGA
jgi:hypothetical protein